MWRCSETELNWVRIATRLIPELMQLLMGMSISRYFPAIGTAGLERIFVKGCKRVPLPPPIITPRTSFMAGIVNLHIGTSRSRNSSGLCERRNSACLFRRRSVDFKGSYLEAEGI